jgi:hypothetical protein
MKLEGSTHDLAAIYGVLLAGWHLVALRDGRADPALARMRPGAVVAGRTVRLFNRSGTPPGLRQAGQPIPP